MGFFFVIVQRQIVLHENETRHSEYEREQS